MATVSFDSRILEPTAGGAAGTAAPAAKPGFFSRLLSAAAASRQRRAERVIAAFIERRGGRITDELERQIESRFASLG